MRETGIILAVVAALMLTGCQSGGKTSMPEASDILVIRGATIVTGTGESIRDGAVVVSSGRLAWVGPVADLPSSYRGAASIDASGLTVLPGLVDAHAHVLSLGNSLEIVDLVGTRSFDEVVDRMVEGAKSLPDGEWIRARGWDQNDWAETAFPTADELDRVFPDRPAYATRIDGHAILANRRAMNLAGISASTPDPDGGRMIRHEDGRPTGVFIDNAIGLVSRYIPAQTRNQKKRQLERAVRFIASKGLTGVHDAGVDQETIDLYRELADEGRLPVRIYGMLDDNMLLLASWFAKGPLLDYGDRLTVRCVKLYADGALGSRGAALLEPYVDDPGNLGLLLSSPQHLLERVRRAREAGFQVGVHAIGDRGNRVVLDVYEEAGVTPADRFRIEHFQVVAIDDIPRLAKSGIIASMQPTHGTSDMPWAEERVGPNRVRGSYAWRTILASGAVLAFGSDFPVEAVDPMLGIYAAVTRQDREGNPPGGWHPEESLTPLDAIQAFSSGAAYASFQEDELGTISPGKRADLTIVDANPLTIDSSRLDDVGIRYTIVGGSIVFEAN